MLDQVDPADLISQLPCRIELPDAWKEYFSVAGTLPPIFDDRRRFPRHHCRTPAALYFAQHLPLDETDRVRARRVRQGHLAKRNLFLAQRTNISVGDVRPPNAQRPIATMEGRTVSATTVLTVTKSEPNWFPRQKNRASTARPVKNLRSD